LNPAASTVMLPDGLTLTIMRRLTGHLLPR
jgi:hypothetical protein